MKKVINNIGVIIFLIFEVLCALGCIGLFFATLALAKTFAIIHLAHIAALMFITSILGIFNTYVSIYTFLKRKEE